MVLVGVGHLWFCFFAKTKQTDLAHPCHALRFSPILLRCGFATQNRGKTELQKDCYTGQAVADVSLPKANQTRK